MRLNCLELKKWEPLEASIKIFSETQEKYKSEKIYKKLVQNQLQIKKLNFSVLLSAVLITHPET